MMKIGKFRILYILTGTQVTNVTSSFAPSRKVIQTIDSPRTVEFIEKSALTKDILTDNHLIRQRRITGGLSWKVPQGVGKGVEAGKEVISNHY